LKDYKNSGVFQDENVEKIEVSEVDPLNYSKLENY